MEEIIIDGVNVSGCYGKTPYKNDYGQVQCKCFRFLSDDDETYLLGICEQHPNCHYKQLARKEKECDELKKSIAILNDTVKTQARTIDKTQSDWFNNYSEMKNKYEKTLQEIKEIAEPIYEQIPDDKVLRQILLKISEVEE